MKPKFHEPPTFQVFCFAPGSTVITLPPAGLIVWAARNFSSE